MIAALVLAGGKSERMGSPKALLRFEGETFVERILRVVDESQIGPRVVVAGEHLAEIRVVLGDVPVVFNPDYESGMTTSFQAGIRALPEDVEGVVVFLVDHPLVSSDTVRALLGHRQAARVVVPVYRGRRGHPVYFSREFMSRILAVGPEVGVNTLVRSENDRVVEVPLQDPGVLVDVDTPEDFRRLSGKDREEI